jgi:hypothetical protein
MNFLGSTVNPATQQKAEGPQQRINHGKMSTKAFCSISEYDHDREMWGKVQSFMLN